MWNRFWMHFGSIFVNSWRVGSICDPLGGSELGAKRLPKSLILGSPWGPLGVPLGSLSSEISLPFLLKKLDCFLHAFWVTKWSQMLPEMKPNFIQNSSCFRLRSHTAFHPAFGKFFSRFPKRPTFDSTAIYSVFLGLSLFGKVQKGSQNDHPKWRQGAPKTSPKPSKGQSKN